ncbi:MAG: sensor histidine kinase [Anaerolineaceae bacterium]|jgi:signal transduction histidine kinase
MAGTKQQRFKTILKTSSKFILAFIILTVLYALLNIGVIVFLSGNLPIYEYVPIRQNQDPMKLNWEEIHVMGGYGYVVDEEGTILWHSEGSEESGKISIRNFLDQNLTRKNNRSNFIYKTVEGNWLILNYPSDSFSNEPTYNLNVAPVSQQRVLVIIIIVLIVLYLLEIFFLFHRLSAHLEANVQEIYEAEEEKKRFFFRGLAHDLKTPLSTIMAYSKAIGDGLLKEEQVDHYVETIYRQSDVLKNRLDDMMAYASLEERLAENMQISDLLEAIRRYVGENYDWFREKNAEIDIRFQDNVKYRTNFDQGLFARLLQNILNNSVEHNAPGVNIYIAWNAKEKCLILGDDGVGVPDQLRDTLFDPMVTGEPSRTGEHFRGMGLANVKRIVQLHGWDISYDGEFKIKLR